MPIPVSRTENFSFTRLAVRSSTLGRHDDLAAFRELHRVVDQVDQDLSEPQRIADQVRRNIRLRGDQELQILFVRLLTDNGGQIFEDIFETEFGVLDVQLAGLDLREVENVVDDAQQRCLPRS